MTSTYKHESCSQEVTERDEAHESINPSTHSTSPENKSVNSFNKVKGAKHGRAATPEA